MKAAKRLERRCLRNGNRLIVKQEQVVRELLRQRFTFAMQQQELLDQSAACRENVYQEWAQASSHSISKFHFEAKDPVSSGSTDDATQIRAAVARKVSTYTNEPASARKASDADSGSNAMSDGARNPGKADGRRVSPESSAAVIDC